MRDFQLPGRSPVYGLRGAAATSQPLATGVALDVLKAGGNAIDAAVAACAVLGVVEPQSTGIGGDCFVLYAPEGRVPPVTINGSGRAPSAATIDWFIEQGIDTIGFQSPHSVTIPGAVGAWAKLVSDHGTRSLGELLQPAVRYAEEGYVVAPRIAADWARNVDKLHACDTAKRIFLPGGKAPVAGQVHRQPELAQTLARIGEGGRDAFYTGEVAEDIVGYLRSLGSLMTLDDFAAYEPQYVDPISTNYRGYDVYECPPNGQGVVALIMLNILAGFDLASMESSGAQRLHLEAEATRLAYRDRAGLLADPDLVNVPVEHLLSADYAERMRSLIDPSRAMTRMPPAGGTQHRDTVYLTVVDDKGGAVSFINSTFHSFGSGLCAPKSGVMLQNRGASFLIDPEHPNQIEPNKRPMHTIIPGMVAKGGRAVMPFGVMGGHYQACGHAHVLTNMIDYGMDVQEALDAPRAFHFEDVLELETTISPDVAAALQAKGHNTRWAEVPIGGGQAIQIDPDTGVLTAASESRKDGCALVW
ncbi:MAG: gamma-glutamyltransferase [Alphaproteobacteria bacterium]|nr:gamma-glutamyltransferase [Alphaproteobacteria bacterium]